LLPVRERPLLQRHLLWCAAQQLLQRRMLRRGLLRRELLLFNVLRGQRLLFVCILLQRRLL